MAVIDPATGRAGVAAGRGARALGTLVVGDAGTSLESYPQRDG